MKLLLFLMDIPLFCAGRKVSGNEKMLIVNSLQSGDIVLAADKLFPLWQLVIRLLFRSNYYHSAIYENNGQVIEATTRFPDGSGVMRTNIGAYISGYKNICVIRPPYADGSERQKAVDFAASQLGKPYDYAMQMCDNGSFYCSKLVAAALKNAGISVKQSQFLGKRGFAPDNFIHIKNAKTVYGNNNDVLPNLLLRLLVFAAICSLPLAAIIGFALIIAGAGLYQFYHSPSNSVIKLFFNKKYVIL